MTGAAELELLASTIERLFAKHCDPPPLGRAGHDARAALWTELAGLAVPWIGIPESIGGGGGAADAVAAVVRLAGAHSVPLPLAETMVAGAWAARLGLADIVGRPVTVAGSSAAELLEVRRDGDELIVNGRLDRVPWAQAADVVLAASADRLFAVSVADATCEPATDLAGDARDSLVVENVRIARRHQADVPDADAKLLAYSAAGRVVAMAGAAARALQLTVEHVRARVQFGKPLATFQAVQQLLAQLAGASALLQAAAQLAVTGVDDDDTVALASAATTAASAAATAAATAHQLHGAIGLTAEHRLHRATMRLQAWRDEFGNERHWARQVGSIAIATDGEPWHQLVPA